MPHLFFLSSRILILLPLCIQRPATWVPGAMISTEPYAIHLPHFISGRGPLPSKWGSGRTRQDDFFGRCNATAPLAYSSSFLTADTGSRPEPQEAVKAEYSGTPAWVDLLPGRPCLTSCSGWDWTLDLGRLLTTEFGKMPASLGFWSSCALCWPQCLMAQSAGAAFPGWQQEPVSLPQESALSS